MAGKVVAWNGTGKEGLDIGEVRDCEKRPWGFGKRYNYVPCKLCRREIIHGNIIGKKERR